MDQSQLSGMTCLPPTSPTWDGTTLTRKRDPHSLLIDRFGRLWRVDGYGTSAWAEGIDAPTNARPLTFLEFEVGPMVVTQ